jgi:hypothetical protein
MRTASEYNTAKEVLEMLDYFLAQDNDESAKLWSVLTALRGPDSLSSMEKYATTGVIRVTAFPKSFTKDYHGIVVGPNGSVAIQDSEENKAIRSDLEKEHGKHYHFFLHVYEAFHALGLVWNKSNSKETESK